MKHNFIKRLKGAMTLLFWLVSSTIVMAQSIPQGINYQAVARDNKGNSYSNYDLIVEISIHQNAANGLIVWQEGHQVTTNDFGLFNLVIGNGTNTGRGTLNSFKDIAWSKGPYYLQVRVDYGNGLVNMGTMPFLSVPYALVADSVINVTIPKNLNPDTIKTMHIVAQSLQIPKGAGMGMILGSDANGNATWQSLSGDVTGPINNLNVIGLQGYAISPALPQADQVLKWNAGNNRWEPSVDQVGPTYIAGSGLQLNGTTFNADSNRAIWNAGQLAGTNLGTLTPADGQTLKWNAANNQWEIGSDQVNTYSAGVGITLNASTFDADKDSAIWNAAKLQGATVSSNTATNGQVLKWNATNSSWEPSADNNTNYNAGNGITITGTTIDADASTAMWNANKLQGSDVSNVAPSIDGQILKWNTSSSKWELGSDEKGQKFAGTGITISNDSIIAKNGTAMWNASHLSGTLISPALAPSLNQVLKWNGVQWDVANDNTGNTYTAGSGIVINGNTINADSVKPIWNASKLQGNNIDVNAPANGQILKWDATTSTWKLDSDNGASYTTGIGINLTGTQLTAQNDSIIWNANRLRGDSLSTKTAVAGDLLQWDGSAWTPSAVAGAAYTSGTGIKINGNVINALIDSTYWNAGRLQGDSVSTQNPLVGEILKWDGNAWAPAADGGTSYTAGTGIIITGNTIDADNATAMWNADKLQGNNVSATAPSTNGQVLKWNATTKTWEPGTDTNTTYTAGAGITFAGTTINADMATALWNANQIQSRVISAVQPGNNQVLTWDSANTVWKPVTFATTGVSTFTGDTGISVSQTGNTVTIKNTGDRDPSDDITTSTAAGGDLSGTYPNPTVVGLQGNPLSSTAPSNGQILKWDGSNWTPASDSGRIYKGIDGIAISTDSVSVDLDNSSGLTFTAGKLEINTGTGLTITGTHPNSKIEALNTVALWNAVQLQGRNIDGTAPNTGQVLKWDGTNWAPGTDTGTVYTGGDGIAIDASNVIRADVGTNSGLQITGSKLDINTGNGLEKKFGKLQVDLSDNSGLKFNLNGLEIDPGTNLSLSGGTLEVDYASAVWNADKLQGNSISATAPSTNGQVLKWNATTSVWEPGTDANTTYTGGTGITITGTTIDADASTAMWNADKLQGSDVSTTAPSTNGQVLKWNATTSVWEPGTDANTTYTGGTGITITGTTIDADASTAMWNADKLQGSDVSTTAPSTNGQVLKWNATASVWEPGTDANTTYTGGTGVTITGTTIDADASTAMWNADKLQGSDVSTTAPSTNGQVLKWNATTSVWEPGTDANTTYTGGTGVTITGTTIDADASTAMWNADKLQGSDISSTAPSTNGQVLKWNATTSVWEPGTDATNTYTGGDGIAIDASNVIRADVGTNSGLQITGSKLDINTGNGLEKKLGKLQVDLSDNSGLKFNLNGLEIDPGTNLSLSGGTLEVAYTSAVWNADKLQGNSISATAPSTNGQVLKWNATTSVWEPGTDANTTYTGGTGVTITGTTIDADASTAMWNADKLQGNNLSSTAPSNGEVLKWNSTTSVWEPASDNSATYTGGTGITITGTTIDADASTAMWNADKLQGSDISSTAPSANGQVLKWNATTSVWEPGTDATNTYTGGTGITITGTTIDADASTAMWNADKLQGSDISSTAPSANGQVLKWNATTSVWEPGTDATNTYTGGTGITITGTTIDADASTAMWNADKLQGSDISSTAPSANGQVLKWNATTSVWEPGTDATNTYTGGDGIAIDASNVISSDVGTNSGLQITGSKLDINTGNGLEKKLGKLQVDLSDNSGLKFNLNGLEIDPGTNLSLSGGTLEVAYTSAVWNADKLQGNTVSSSAPSNGQVLKWNSTTSVWEPAADNTATMTGGDGITVTGTVADVDLVTNGGLEISATQLKATYETAMWNADKIQGTSVSTTAPSSGGQVLAYNATSSKWEAGNGNAITDADNNTKIQVEESANENKIRFDNNGKESMIIDRVSDTARVGIGTSSPTSVLSVAGSYDVAITTTTSAIYLGIGHSVVLINNNSLIVNVPAYLPDASSCKGRVYTIKSIGSGNAILIPKSGSGQKIDGSNSKSVSGGNAIQVVSDGSDWYSF